MMTTRLRIYRYWRVIERKANGGYVEHIMKNEKAARDLADRLGTDELHPFPCHRYGGNLYPVRQMIGG